ncbi:PDC sensor domain-containing protein [Roseateles albus]|uniref:Double Cache domain-containing protein n=1 Tax=Roseateles albus TaxID=2987525 RepID=A0ABT5KGS6_9BURK|nr:hypothetical protein [Roseateles albus]MDC8773108.1 hypothetical protein [Roseateles albus]
MEIRQAGPPSGDEMEAPELAVAQTSRRFALLCYLIALPITLLIAFELIGSSLQHMQLAREQAHARVKAVATAAATSLQQQLGRDLVLLKNLAREAARQDADAARCARFSSALVRLDQVLVNLSVRDLHGELICELVSPHGRLPPSPASLQNASLSLHSAGRWLTWLTQPLFDSSGQRLGSLNLQLDLLQMSERLREGLPSHAVVEVLSRQQTIVARSSDAAAFIGRVNVSADALRDLLGRQGFREGEFSAPLAPDEGPRLNHVVSIAGTDWRLLAGLPQAELFADAEAMLRHSLALGLAFVMLITWLSWRIGLSLIVLNIGRSKSNALP